MSKKPSYQELELELKRLKSNSKLQRVLKDLIYIELDAKGIVTKVNTKTCKTLGYIKKEILGKNWFHNFLPERIRNEVFLDYKSDKKQSEFCENLILTKKGKELNIYWHNIYNKDDLGNITGVLSFGEDITKSKQSEIKLKESEHKFKSIIENAGDAMYMANFNGKIIEVNKVACKSLGYTEKELLCLNVTELDLDYTDLDKAKNFWNTLEYGKSYTLESKHKRKDGSTFPVEIRITLATINNEKVTLGFACDITHRKIAEKKLKESEQLLKKAEKIAKIGYWDLDHANNNITWSDEVFRIFNLEPQKFKPTYDAFLERVHPKDRDKVNTAFSESLTSKKPYEITHRIQLDSKKIKYILERCVTNFDKEGKPLQSIGTVQDITESYKSKLKLAKATKLVKVSEEKFKSLFNNNPVSLWEENVYEVMKLLNKKIKESYNIKLYLDENPKFVQECISKIKILNINKSTLSLLNVPNKEALMSNFHLYFNSKSLETFKKILVLLTTNETKSKFETELVRSDGKVINVLLNLVKVQGCKIILTFNNITELKEAKRSAVESDRLKTEFINNMSHEIRTPMNGILGFSGLLSDPEITESKKANFIKIINNSGYQLLRIIDDILEISRLGTKQVKVIDEEVCLNDLFFELFSIFDKKAKENKTPLFLKKGLSNERSTILIDRVKLNKVLSNLLENSIKFTRVGSIEIGYQLITINKTPQLEIYVKDTGVGIKLEDQKIIFERFVQTRFTDLSKKGGLGLGLSIAKENTELLKGSISVKSKKGEGTTFFVTIPYNPVKTFIQEKDIRVKGRKTILIAEDEEVNFLYLDTVLRDVLKLDYVILHAKNGQEAIDICNNNSKVDLIFMDLKMPLLNGYEATKQIKATHPNIPIIAQTAYSTKEETKKAITAGCDTFIIKPINTELLISVLKKFIPVL